MLNIGDKVICISKRGITRLVIGEFYTIIKTERKNSAENGVTELFVKVKPVNSSHFSPRNWFFASRFKPTEIKDIITQRFLNTAER